MNINPVHISKQNSNHEKKKKKKKKKSFSDSKWRRNHLAVKKISALLRGITSKHVGDFYCLNCLHSCKTKNKLESQKKLVK